MHRTQRFSRIEPFTWQHQEANQDSRSYKPNGTKFSFGLYPKLTSLLPDIENVELSVREGKRAPETSPLHSAFRAWSEVQGVPYLVYIAVFSGGVLPLMDGEQANVNLQAVGVILKRTGEVVKVVQSVFIDEAETLAYVVNSFAFNYEKKPVDSHLLRTEILPVDEVNMIHQYTAEVQSSKAFPATYKVTNDVKELRAAGVNLQKFQYFKEAIVWNINGEVPVLLALDHFQRWHVVTIDKDSKGARMHQHANTFTRALYTAKNISQNV